MSEPRQITVHIVLAEDEICYPSALADLIAGSYSTQFITVLEADKSYRVNNQEEGTK